MIVSLTADKLRLKRKGQGLSQAKLAALLGVHTGTVQRWEQETGTVPAYVNNTLELHKRMANEKRRQRAWQRRKKAKKAAESKTPPPSVFNPQS